MLMPYEEQKIFKSLGMDVSIVKGFSLLDDNELIDSDDDSELELDDDSYGS